VLPGSSASSYRWCEARLATDRRLQCHARRGLARGRRTGGLDWHGSPPPRRAPGPFLLSGSDCASADLCGREAEGRVDLAREGAIWREEKRGRDRAHEIRRFHELMASPLFVCRRGRMARGVARMDFTVSFGPVFC
jgi:hypothetical protein